VSSHDRLSALDASFLQLERIHTPMHTGALAVFEGAPLRDADGRLRLAEVRALVASRLHLIPRFRKRVMTVPMEAGTPVWVDDEHFDLAYHVRSTTLPPPGSRAQLLDAFGRLQTRLLGRDRPLWELWFVDGIEGDHVGLVLKAHHALVDGVSGVDVALALLDFSPEPVVLDAPAWRPRPAPTPGRLLIDSLRERVLAPDTREAARRVSEAVRSIGRVAEGAPVATRTSLNHPVGRHRRFGLARVPLEDVKVIRRAFGGTVNDVVLAGVGGGLARLLESRGELTPDLTLQVFCPVSLRDESHRLQLGNRISAMNVPLAVGEPDPIARLHAVQEATAVRKEREQAAGAAAILGLGDFLAPPLMGLATRAVHRQRFFNLVCTNIPVPQAPLYCLGARMLEAYPLVPLSANMNLGVAVLSYCGEVHIGLLADRGRWPDLARLEAGLDASFAELKKLAEGAPAGDAVGSADGPPATTEP
jgi:diacylglycerol O-acyltransferase / wax synthase